MKVGIESIVRYAPEHVIPKNYYDYILPELEKLPPLLRDAFSGDNAPEEVRRDEPAPDRAENMAIKVGKKLLKETGMDPNEIDFVIGGATMVHKELGLRKDAPMLNIADCCASFVDALQIAWNLVELGEAKKVLVIASAALAGGEVQSTTDLTDFVAPVFGDGAAACIVSSENLKAEFLSFEAETDGRAYRSARGDISLPRHPQFAKHVGIPETEGTYFKMDDISYIMIASRLKYLGDSLDRMAAKAGIEAKDINMVITHHLPDCEAAWIQDCEDYGLGREAFKNFRQKYGNTGHTDLPMDLVHFIEEGTIKTGDNIVIWVPGSGISLGGILMKWVA